MTKSTTQTSWMPVCWCRAYISVAIEQFLVERKMAVDEGIHAPVLDDTATPFSAESATGRFASAKQVDDLRGKIR